MLLELSGQLMVWPQLQRRSPLQTVILPQQQTFRPVCCHQPLLTPHSPQAPPPYPSSPQPQAPQGMFAAQICLILLLRTDMCIWYTTCVARYSLTLLAYHVTQTCLHFLLNHTLLTKLRGTDSRVYLQSTLMHLHMLPSLMSDASCFTDHAGGLFCIMLGIRFASPVPHLGLHTHEIRYQQFCYALCFPSSLCITGACIVT